MSSIPDDLVPKDAPYPIVLGIDPGTLVVGWGAIVDVPGSPRLLGCGVLSAPRRASLPERLARISHGLDELLEKLRPAVLAVESAFAARNIQSAFRIGEARGVILALAGRRGLTVTQVAPMVAKKAVLGNGRASEEQVAAMLPSLFGLEEKLDVPVDATDALAVALAHLRQAEHPGLSR